MKRLIHYPKHITSLQSSLTHAFSLIELTVAVAVATLLMSAVISSTYVLHKGFIRNEQQSESIKSMADFMGLVTSDTLNPDIYPHHPTEAYQLEEQTISFFASGGAVTYSITDGIFTITRDDRKRTFPVITDFTVSYFDVDGFETRSDEFPHSCEMNFAFYDTKITQISMRL